MKQKLTNPIPLLRLGIQKHRLIIKLVLITFILSIFQSNINYLGASNLNANSDNLLQQITITGVVKDISGQAMPGVSVRVEGTTIGALSDVNGRYTIEVPRNDMVLIFSFVGYAELRTPLNGRTVVDVTMEETMEALEEIVVVGYGTQRKKDVTSAIAVVDAQSIYKMPVSSATNALVGLAPGIEVQSNQGKPGTLATIRIRGVGSVNTTDPLWVVDGIPVGDSYGGSVQDIESIQVLKDAASCAIYGSRGANGVIIVTTKTGKKGAPKVSYNGYYGWETPWKTLDLLNIEQWAAMVVENNNAGGTTPPPLATDIVAHGYSGQETDWQKEIFQTGAITEHALNISGGVDAGNYYFSVTNFAQDGIIIDTKYKRYSVRMNSNWQTGKFKFGESITFGYSQNEAEDTNGGRSTIEETIKITPNIPVHNPNVLGGYSGYDATLVGHDASNPVGSLMRATNMNYGKSFLANAYGEYEIIKGLAFRTTFVICSQRTMPTPP
jgi:TonB-linked SusC/RagA family outer membrane protein